MASETSPGAHPSRNIRRAWHAVVRPRFRPKSLFRWRDRRWQAQKPRNNRGSQFRLELLEDRQLLSNFTVTDGSDTAGSSTDVTLRYAITQAIEAGGSSTIGFSRTMENLTNNTITPSTNDPSGANVYGPTAFVINGASITIDGSGDPGLVLSGGDAMRLFAVTSTGTLTLEDLTLSDGLAAGGAGGSSNYGGGGGGAAGLGGAVYNDDGAFTAEGVTFTNNTAQGGAGGSVGFDGAGFGGGGGGLGGSGQSGGTPGGNHATGGSLGGGHGGSSRSDGDAGGFGGGGGGGGASAARGGNGGSGGFGGGGGGGMPTAGFVMAPPAVSQGLAAAPAAAAATWPTAAAAAAPVWAAASSATAAPSLWSMIPSPATRPPAAPAGSRAAAIPPRHPGQGLGGTVFVRNSNLQATFVTFSSDTVTNGDESAGTASEVYTLGDGNGSTFVATFVDDILGQSGDSTVNDFVAGNYDVGTTPDTSASSNDLVTNNPDSGDALTGTDIIGGDPMLGALASNGGPTQSMVLQAGSAAIGAGITAVFPGTDTDITADQRGVSRPSSPDLGAFEVAPMSYVVTDATDGTGSSTDVTLRYAITQSLAAGGNTTITFDPSLAGLTIALTSDDASGDHGYGPTAFVIDEPGITIDGSAAPGLTIGGDGARRVFAVTETASLTLEDLTVSDGLARDGRRPQRRWHSGRWRRRRRGRARGWRLQRWGHIHGRWGYLREQHGHGWERPSGRRRERSHRRTGWLVRRNRRGRRRGHSIRGRLARRRRRVRSGWRRRRLSESRTAGRRRGRRLWRRRRRRRCRWRRRRRGESWLWRRLRIPRR